MAGAAVRGEVRGPCRCVAGQRVLKRYAFHESFRARVRSNSRHKTGILDTTLSRNPSQSHWNHIQKFREGIQSFEMSTSRRHLECLAAVQASSLALGEPSAHPKREGLSRHTSHARESKDKPCKHLRGECLLDRLCSRRASTSLHSESRERKALPSQSDPDSSTFPPTPSARRGAPHEQHSASKR